MPINCFNTGRSFVKGLEQNVTIGSMIGLLLLCLVPSCIGLILNSSWLDYQNSLCKDFGIDKKEYSTEGANMAFWILTLNTLILLGGIF